MNEKLGLILLAVVVLLVVARPSTCAISDCKRTVSGDEKYCLLHECIVSDCHSKRDSAYYCYYHRGRSKSSSKSSQKNSAPKPSASKPVSYTPVRSSSHSVSKNEYKDAVDDYDDAGDYADDYEDYFGDWDAAYDYWEDHN